MSNEHSLGLHNQNSQSFKYSLQEMNFNTNFEHINQGEFGYSLQSTFYLSLQRDNNLVFNSIKKEEGKPLMLQFPPFNTDKQLSEPLPSKPTPSKSTNKTKTKLLKSKDVPKKGLRQISQQVKQLVCQRNGLTYNDVAQFVIDDNKQVQQSSDLEKSAAVNIKRRVYDVLAVLSSLKLLQRDSKKKIFATEQCHKIGVGTCKNKQQLQQLSKSIFDVKDSIRQKEQLLKKSLSQYTKLRQLSQRNIGFIQQQNNLREKQIDRYFGNTQLTLQEESIDLDNSKKINFPFVYCLVDQKSQITLNHSNSSSVLVLQGINQQLHGDLNFITHLTLPECSPDPLIQQISALLSTTVISK